MSNYFQKPENALKRANELINLPNMDPSVIKRQKNTAVQLLHDILVSKKHRTWQKTHEQIILLYLDICVDLQLSRVAKDGLHQYRNMTLQQNPQSLEVAIRHLIESAESRASNARQRSNEKVIMIEDLEAGQSPEAILLSTTTSEDLQDRTDRALLVPWLRFLWESYRTVLEILRFNSSLEHLYKEVALKAYRFCVEYNRKIEFRRLCDIIRNHLQTLQKKDIMTLQSRQMRAWDGWSSESFEIHLQIRYEQLEIATSLELWNEGFRTIEDIHSIMTLVKKAPKASLMATYYEKLSQIFFVSKNSLFHAYALHKFFLISRSQNTKLTSTEISKMASQVVLASLSISLYEEPSSKVAYDLDLETQKMQRMSSLLGFASPPKRQTLIAQLGEQQILQQALPEISALFEHLEMNFQPLKVVSLVKPIFQTLKSKSEFSDYIGALENLLVHRLLNQLTTVYDRVTISHLTSLLNGLNVSFHQVERMIVQSVKQGRYHVQIDHRQGCLHFGQLSMETPEMHEHLMNLSFRLSKCVDSIQALSGQPMKKTKENQDRLYKQTLNNLEDDQARYLNRKIIIEKKKEDAERLQQEIARIEEQKRKDFEKQRCEQEKARLEQEAKRREQEKRQRIKEEIALKETKQMLDRLGQDTESMEIQDLETVDREKIFREAREKAAKAKEEAQKKLRDQAKRLDYIVRATREAEQPILAKQQKEEAEDAAREREESWKSFLQTHREEFEYAIKEKTRFKRMEKEHVRFAKSHEGRRKVLYEEELAQHRARVALERLQAKVERAQERQEAEMERRRREEEEERIRREKEMKREAELALEKEKEREKARQQEIADSQWKRGEVSNVNKDNEGEWQHVSKPTRTERRPNSAPRRDFMDRERTDEREGPWRRGGRQEPMDRSRGEEREGPWRRGGRPESSERAPLDRPRGGDDRDGPLRRGGRQEPMDRERNDEREGPWRRGGRQEPMDRPRGEEREGPWRRGGRQDTMDRPRVGDEREGPWRRGGRQEPMDRPRAEEREGPWRRGNRQEPMDRPRGEEREGPWRRGPRDDSAERRRDGGDGFRRGPRGDSSERRFDRRDGPSDREGPWRRGGRPEERRDDGGWKRAGDRRDRRDDRRDDGGSWRRGGRS